MNNKNGIRILDARPARLPEPEVMVAANVVIADAFVELIETSPRFTPRASVNTQLSISATPELKGVRQLGKLSMIEALKIRMSNFGHRVRQTGVYAR